MNEHCILAICVETENAMYKFTAFTNRPLNDELISDVIRESFASIGSDYISVDSVEDIFVAFASENSDGIISPEIDDVWPSDFSSEMHKRDTRKKGGENYRHGKDDVFKNRR